MSVTDPAIQRSPGGGVNTPAEVLQASARKSWGRKSIIKKLEMCILTEGLEVPEIPEGLEV